MQKIHILPSALADKIAAGEVVERPSSVVKELVENAIDAHATDILVDVVNGGLEAITVIDDGEGMSPEDLTTSICRHATSKIVTDDDLWQIQTLGFRGEALPSIGSVSHLRIESRQAGADVGYRLAVDGSVVAPLTECGCAKGTKVDVIDLFYNVPARRKFLKTLKTEFSHIDDHIRRLALAYPTIRFRLRHNGRDTLRCVGTTLVDRFHEVTGSRDAMTTFDESVGPLQLSGLLGAPEQAKPRQMPYLYVNRRPVRDRLLVSAVCEGYRTWLPNGLYPPVVMMIEMPADEVDVNVHPTKAEVRFVNGQGVYGGVVGVIRKCLERDAAFQTEVVSPPISTSVPLPPSAQPRSLPRESGYTRGLFDRPTSREQSSAILNVIRPVSSEGSSFAHEFRPIGQLGALYLLYEGEGGTLIVIDQHAAHERLGYEAFKKQLTAGGIESQPLLVPEVIHLAPREAAAILEARELLEKAGLVVEDFGGNSIAVTAVPALLGAVSVKRLIEEMAADCLDKGHSSALESRLDHILATMACHRQVRAGDVLSSPEAEALIVEMRRQSTPDRCPHGRPTWIRLTTDEISKWFHRT